jgi:ABC-type Fe3+-hydroxamate transport system substrate-binding protein
MTKLGLALVTLAASAALALPAIAAPLTTSDSNIRLAQATEKVVVKKPAKKKVIVKKPKKKVVVGTPGVAVVTAPAGCKMVTEKVRRSGKVVVKKVRRC